MRARTFSKEPVYVYWFIWPLCNDTKGDSRSDLVEGSDSEKVQLVTDNVELTDLRLEQLGILGVVNRVRVFHLKGRTVFGRVDEKLVINQRSFVFDNRDYYR